MNLRTEEIERSIMSARQAWKAFRMGVLASGAQFPMNGAESQEYWNTMRRRFDQWYADYRRSKEDLIKRAQVRRASRGMK